MLLSKYGVSRIIMFNNRHRELDRQTPNSAAITKEKRTENDGTATCLINNDIIWELCELLVPSYIAGVSQKGTSAKCPIIPSSQTYARPNDVILQH